ncbi:MAG: hypothetical protein IPK63_09715 [Candidatus Competibacteraceae bacterium]|nr:hypothetical protein [Candidatus Competibacteraceae bacterium]
MRPPLADVALGFPTVSATDNGPYNIVPDDFPPVHTINSEPSRTKLAASRTTTRPVLHIPDCNPRPRPGTHERHELKPGRYAVFSSRLQRDGPLKALGSRPLRRAGNQIHREGWSESC